MTMKSEMKLFFLIQQEVTDEEFTISASESVELPQDLEDIFAKLSPEDVKTIINQIASTVLNDLQVGCAVFYVVNLFIVRNGQ